MKARGRSARVGDVISYIFCISPGEDAGKSAQADRAKHPNELKKVTSKEFSIDYEHYWHTRYYHLSNGCAIRSRALIGLGWLNASVSGRAVREVLSRRT